MQNYTTQELINELSSRPGVKKIAVGRYKSYSLKEKYTINKKEINCKCVLVIDDFLSTPDNSSMQT